MGNDEQGENHKRDRPGLEWRRGLLQITNNPFLMTSPNGRERAKQARETANSTEEVKMCWQL